MLFTSYFGNLKSLPKNIIPISICGKAPDWYNGLQYKKLAPKYEFFMKWKENHDNDYYVECFNEQVLSKLNPKQVFVDLLEMTPSDITFPNIALICYEKPNEFCHRHLVAKWLEENGYECKEWINCE